MDQKGEYVENYKKLSTQEFINIEYWRLLIIAFTAN